MTGCAKTTPWVWFRRFVALAMSTAVGLAVFRADVPITSQTSAQPWVLVACAIRLFGARPRRGNEPPSARLR